MLPQQHAPPPPQPVPAQIQTVNAAHAQRLASPGQSVINDVNSGKYGKGFTASMPNSTQQNTTQQNMQNAKNAAQNAGSVAKGVQDAKSQANINRERNNALSQRVPGQRPPDKSSGNKAIADMKAKSSNAQQTAPQSISQASQNKGITAARQKSSPGQSGTSQSSSSANKGISSFQSRASGQSSAATGSSSGASKGGQSR